MIAPKHPVIKEIEILCSELVEGNFDEQKQRRIEELVLENPEAQQVYIDYINLHVALTDCTEDDLLPEADLPDSNGDLPVPLLSVDLSSTNSLISNLFLGFLVVCLISITLTGAWIFGKARGSQKVMTAQESKARVSDAMQSLASVEGNQKFEYVAELTWLGETNANGDYLHQPTGSTLTKGETIRIRQGDVHVRFVCGAEVTLHGPALFRIESEMLAKLEYGSLEAKVPPQATGFLIDTPATRVIDLGTEFGLAVEKSGETNVRVLDGEVETKSCRPILTAPESRPRCLLRKGDALLFKPPLTESLRVDFDKPDCLDVFDIVRHDPTACFLDPAAGLLTLKTQRGTIIRRKNNNVNVLVVPIPDCDFDAVLQVKRFEPTQLATHLSLAAFGDQNNVCRSSYWFDCYKFKRSFVCSREEDDRPHGFLENADGVRNHYCDMGDRPFRLRIARKSGVISAYWAQESGPWVSSGEAFSSFTPRFIGFFATNPDVGPRGPNREFIDCVIDSFEIKITSPKQ